MIYSEIVSDVITKKYFQTITEIQKKLQKIEVYITSAANLT